MCARGNEWCTPHLDTDVVRHHAFVGNTPVEVASNPAFAHAICDAVVVRLVEAGAVQNRSEYVREACKLRGANMRRDPMIWHSHFKPYVTGEINTLKPDPWVSSEDWDAAFAALKNARHAHFMKCLDRYETRAGLISWPEFSEWAGTFVSECGSDRFDFIPMTAQERAFVQMETDTLALAKDDNVLTINKEVRRAKLCVMRADYLFRCFERRTWSNVIIDLFDTQEWRDLKALKPRIGLFEETYRLVRLPANIRPRLKQSIRTLKKRIEKDARNLKELHFRAIADQILVRVKTQAEVEPKVVALEMVRAA